MNNIAIANWKMNPASQKEAKSLIKETSILAKKFKNVDVVMCMPFPFLFTSKGKVKSKNLHLGAQNVFPEPEGAYTGEVSVKMLKDMGVSYVITGHSERRAMGETNDMVNKKILSALRLKLLPVLCVGESVRDGSGEYLAFVQKQVTECLAGVSKIQIKNIIIAYEPIWAIGAGAKRVATPEEFLEMQIFIRKIISDMYGVNTAHKIAILYGGSVHPENAASFATDELHDGNACGFLVGRDSLSPKKFGEIISVLNK